MDNKLHMGRPLSFSADDMTDEERQYAMSIIDDFSIERQRQLADVWGDAEIIARKRRVMLAYVLEWIVNVGVVLIIASAAFCVVWFGILT